MVTLLERGEKLMMLKAGCATLSRPTGYFHDGRVFTLEEAVTLMGWHQLDRRLTSGDIADLIAFLGTLEGNPPPVEEPR